MRIMLYSPDSYGLGHVRRSLSVAGALLSGRPRASVRLVTGAPRAHYFDYPSRCDYLKLPIVTKDEGGRYVGTDDDLSLDETVQLRSRLIQEAAESFHSDLLLVDHAPLGLCREILPTLRRLGRSRGGALRILRMRDVIDEPAVVRAAWKKEGVLEVLRDCYDRILVYGQRDLFDPVREYAIPPEISRKLEFVGYIPRHGRAGDLAELHRRFAPRSGRLVLLTLGGGGDGNRLLRVFLDAYEKLGAGPSFEVLAVTGPLMSPGKRARFRERAHNLPGFRLMEYAPNVPELMQAADFVVSMGGYNTVCELASAGARSLIVPRVFPRREQLLRARLLAERGVARCLSPTELDPATLTREILEGLERERPRPGWGLEFTGLDKTSLTIGRMLDCQSLVGPRVWSRPQVRAAS